MAKRSRYAWQPEIPKEVKEQVRQMTFRAIQQGHLELQPCEVCGAIRAEAHHDDYNDPSKLRWLCRRHHKAVHYPDAKRVDRPAWDDDKPFHRVWVSFTVSDEMYSQLRSIADSEGRSLSAVLRRILAKALKMEKAK